METKFEQFQNALPTIFTTHEVQFIPCTSSSCAVRSHKTGMFCGVELIELISLAKKIDVHFYVRSRQCENGVDCVDFVIYI